MKFIEMMKNGKLNLVVSCPKNEYEFVEAAWLNGADAVKIHLNVHHHASGTDFKSMDEEREFVEKLLKNSPVPVGVVLGGSTEVVRKDFKNVLEEEFDFLSVYLHDAVSETLTQDKITRMYACNDTYDLNEIKEIEAIGAEILEVSIVAPDQYGTALNLRDLVHYSQINKAVKIPTLLPTQKKITVEDLPSLKKVGFNGIMIGAIVTSNELETFSNTVKTFREALDAIN